MHEKGVRINGVLIMDVPGVDMWARRFLWLQIIAGWALSLLAVAGFSGLIKSD